MSITELSTSPETAKPTRSAPRRGKAAAMWVRVALACAVLAASGGVRWWQARRIGAVLERGKQSPFPLKDLPTTLGDWQGQEAALDPQIARATGCTDSTFRRYVDQKTGVMLDVIVLYGPSVEMYIHVPEVCYPKAGYEQVEGPDTRTVKVGKLEVPFRSLVYTKGEGGQADREEVYYSLRYNGRWTPQVGVQKQFERIPGMYKVHLARRVTERERRDVGNPCEAFLQVLIPEIERRLSEASPTS